jgi:hypothetical protein
LAASTFQNEGGVSPVFTETNGDYDNVELIGNQAGNRVIIKGMRKNVLDV